MCGYNKTLLLNLPHLLCLFLLNMTILSYFCNKINYSFTNLSKKSKKIE
ncbi:hypothetical protein E9M_00956 [Moraxella catarrhalis 46P47B1]|nr:hypothetical protein EJK50_1476 [Moraxella catarrhalis]EGE14890.1 hypothetical protein E9M_00956 [Moraxella catarrhalis 46P47B1]